MMRRKYDQVFSGPIGVFAAFSIFLVAAFPVIASDADTKKAALSLQQYVTHNMTDEEYKVLRDYYRTPVDLDNFEPLPQSDGMTVSQGKDVPEGVVEDAVFLEMNFSSNAGFSERRCTGVLVHERVVLTAAHCLIPEHPTSQLVEIIVFYGHHSIHNFHTPLRHRGNKIVTAINNDFLPSDIAAGNDIGAIYLKEALTGDGVEPVAFSGARTFTLPHYNFYVVGWGKTFKFDESSPKLVQAENLLYARIPLFNEAGERLTDNTQVCEIRKLMNNDLIRAGGVNEKGARGTCPGDSGAGLYAHQFPDISKGIAEQFGKPTLIGITSFGRNLSGEVTSKDDQFCLHDKSDSNFVNLLNQRAFLTESLVEFGLPADAFKFDDETEGDQTC